MWADLGDALSEQLLGRSLAFPDCMSACSRNDTNYVALVRYTGTASTMGAALRQGLSLHRARRAGADVM